jgi:perosamine synthetase
VIRLMVPDIEAAEIEAVASVLRTGHLVQGRCVEAFEAALAQTVGVRHAVAVSSGTAALHLAIRALGIGPGDLVAVPAYTWPATANVVALAGGHPLFVDIQPSTLGMDPSALERTLDSHPGAKAVMPVHAFGRMADMAAITELARARNVAIVEDAACALGAKLAGRSAGAWGRLGCLSFHPRKIVTTGEGGAVTSDDAVLAHSIRMLRNHGLDPDAAWPEFAVAGYNLRLTEFQAVLGAGQLGRLEPIVAHRRALAAEYRKAFAGTDVECPNPPDPGLHVYQSYVVILPERYGNSRQAVIAGLRARGIEATIGTYHVPLTSYFRARYGHRVGDFPITDAIAGRALTLPLHRELKQQDVCNIAVALLDLLRA